MRSPFFYTPRVWRARFGEELRGSFLPFAQLLLRRGSAGTWELVSMLQPSSAQHTPFAFKWPVIVPKVLPCSLSLLLSLVSHPTLCQVVLGP